MGHAQFLGASGVTSSQLDFSVDALFVMCFLVRCERLGIGPMVPASSFTKKTVEPLSGPVGRAVGGLDVQ